MDGNASEWVNDWEDPTLDLEQAVTAVSEYEEELKSRQVVTLLNTLCTP